MYSDVESYHDTSNISLCFGKKGQTPILIFQVTLSLFTWKKKFHEHRQKMSHILGLFSIAIIVIFPLITIDDFEFEVYNGKERTNKYILPIISQVSGKF